MGLYNSRSMFHSIRSLSVASVYESLLVQALSRSQCLSGASILSLSVQRTPPWTPNLTD